MSRGPSQDSPQFKPTVRAACGRCPVDTLLGDGALDAEHNHALARQRLGVRSTVFPLNRRNAGRKWPKTRYRRSYAVGDDGMMAPEYADIFGVPFTGFPVAGLPEERTPPTPKPGKAVRAVPERLTDSPWLEVTFPRVVGYRFDVPAERLTARFDKSHREVLTTQDMPTNTLNAPIVGEKAELTLDEARGLRPQAVAFRLATHLQQHHFPDKHWLFPQLLDIVRDWLGDPDGESPNVEYGDDTFPGLLLFGEKKHAACEKIKSAILASSGGAKRLRAELQADATGTTAGVSFDTVKTCWTTEPTKCHINLVPQDSNWETIVCEKLEEMDEVKAYAKNQGIGFRIPYTCDGRAGNYFPDLIVKLDDGHGNDRPFEPGPRSVRAEEEGEGGEGADGENHVGAGGQ